MKKKKTANKDTILKNYDVVIIGAGSVGLPLAYYMAEKGVSVAVIEKEASVGRGQNRAAIGGVRATHSDPAKIAICRESIRLLSSMKEEHNIDINWKQGGYLYPVYRAEDEKYLKDLLKIQEKQYLHINWIRPDNITELVPGINTEGLRGGTYSPEDGSASPLRTADAYYRLALQAGADFYLNEKCIAVKTGKKRIDEIHTVHYRFSAGLVINCAGAYAGELTRMSGQDFPVQPDSHEAGITEPVQPLFDPMIVDIRPVKTSQNFYFYQNIEGQVVFCITPSPLRPGYDCDNTSGFLPDATRRLIDIYPRLRYLRVRRTWRGLYPMTPDGFPLIGFNREMENNFLAIGMCGQGFMLGPGLGKIIAETITGRSGTYNFIFTQLSPYRKFESEEALK